MLNKWDLPPASPPARRWLLSSAARHHVTSAGACAACPSGVEVELPALRAQFISPSRLSFRFVIVFVTEGERLVYAKPCIPLLLSCRTELAWLNTLLDFFVRLFVCCHIPCEFSSEFAVLSRYHRGCDAGRYIIRASEYWFDIFYIVYRQRSQFINVTLHFHLIICRRRIYSAAGTIQPICWAAAVLQLVCCAATCMYSTQWTVKSVTFYFWL